MENSVYTASMGAINILSDVNGGTFHERRLAGLGEVRFTIHKGM